MRRERRRKRSARCMWLVIWETVDRLWPSLGQEMGLMMWVLERCGKAAWGREGEDVMTVAELGLEVGGGERRFGEYRGIFQEDKLEWCAE